MNELFKLAVNICILIIIASLVSGLTEHMKNGRLVRSVTALMIITVTLTFLLRIDFKNGDIFLPQGYTVDKSEVWKNTLENVEGQLENEMLNLCRQNGLSIDKPVVKLSTDYESIEIEEINISGNDAHAAKNLIAGYFKIGLAYINIDGV